MEHELKALGKSSEFNFTTPDPSVLEKFPVPDTQSNLAVVIDTDEFSSLCPKTGQPDWARIVVRYLPRRWCVESKSYKLYLAGYRMHGEFHEACTQRILRDLVVLLDPQWLVVEGRFSARGGIRFWPVATFGIDIEPAATALQQQLPHSGRNG